MELTLSTIGDCLRLETGLWANCKKCGHMRELDLTALCQARGERFPIEAVIRKLRCLACGGRTCGVSLVSVKGRAAKMEPEAHKPPV